MIRKILCWLLILVFVGYSIGLIESKFYECKAGSGSGPNNNSGYGTGFFKHSFVMEIWLESVSESVPQALIVIEGYHPETFMLTGHSSPDYDRIALTWNNSIGGYWSYWVDLDTMMLIQEEGKAALNPESLQSLMQLENVTAHNLAILEEVITTIQSARHGELPPPSVNNYKLGNPLNGLIRHRTSASGYVLWHVAGAWAIAWTVFGLFGLIRITRQKNCQAYKRVLDGI
jgi:hypothetical protein